MKIRVDIADMLRAGHSQAAIMRTLHVGHFTVKLAREGLRMPTPLAGAQPKQSLADAFAARTEQLDNGHVRWTGYQPGRRSPQMGYRGQTMTALRVAFLLRHGRDPVGTALRGCDYWGCVAPDHVEDRPMRERNRAAYKAIFSGPL